ncbi:MAG: ROK family protein [Desulfurococcales archaeon]|nr:ROK family protein [Desulfurococcales archaeon]
MEACIGAADVGASKIRVALFRGPRLIARRASPFPAAGGPMAPSRLILEMLESLLAGTPGCGGIEALGVASIGPLDPRRGVVEGTPNAPIKSFPLRRPLEEALGVPVVVANDCNAGAWAEYTLGRGSGLDSLAYIAVGTGIGGGVVIGGRLLVGPRGLGAEVGHLVLEASSRARCGCGGRGHWEALASGSAIPRTARILARGWRGPETQALREALRARLGAEALYAYARGGDAFALHVVDYLAGIHAAGIASVTVAYDAQAVFLGGGALLGGWDLLAPRIRAALGEYLGYSVDVRVERCMFGEDQQLYGAASLVLRRPETL